MKRTGSFTHTALASVRAYLSDLKETGVDGVPAGPVGGGPVQPATAPAPQEPPAAEPETHGPETLERIRRSLGNCLRCKLGQTRTKLVFGTGNPHARIVFVGEGPGADEDLRGEPFVGEAGAVLTRIITAMGLSREEVYICNVVKCRPPKNRDPEADEIAACSPFLQRQIKAIKPEVIVALGRFATQTLLQTKEPIGRLRGRFRDYHHIPVMPTYHPSFLLRNRDDKGPFWEVWDDMVQVLQLLKLPVPEKSRKK